MFTCLIFIILSVLSAFGERTLLCSSENLDIWYTYSGPVYDLSMAITPCYYNGMKRFNVTYTMIPLVQFNLVGIKITVWYNGQKSLEHTKTDHTCPDMKICNVLRGETLHDRIPISLQPYHLLKGKYEFLIEFLNLGDNQLAKNLQINFTFEIR